MKEYFQKLYQYNAWANLKVLGCLEQQHITDEKILNIFSHIISAQFIWLSRINDLPKSTVQLWQTYNLAQLRAMIEESTADWQGFINTHDTFDRVLKYNNFVGDYYENNIRDIMIHLVNHGTYHRGQVALLLRQNGYEPVNTDMITYDRVLLGQLKD